MQNAHQGPSTQSALKDHQLLLSLIVIIDIIHGERTLQNQGQNFVSLVKQVFFRTWALWDSVLPSPGFWWCNLGIIEWQQFLNTRDELVKLNLELVKLNLVCCWNPDFPAASSTWQFPPRGGIGRRSFKQLSYSLCTGKKTDALQ